MEANMAVNQKKALPRIEKLIAPYRIESGKGFRLKDHDPADTGPLESEDKRESRDWLQRGTQWLAELQDKLYAQNHWSVLLIFQAMDAAGKDGTIKHVMSGVNPQGCQVFSFKAPSAEELDHDFMWRCMKSLPERGRIGVFNRSYYEEVLVVRVHEEYLRRQSLPPALITKKLWAQRYEDIAAIERYLTRNGVVILKFFLNVSKDEQKRRFLERLEQPEKNWKFSSADAAERQHWDAYQSAYEDAIRNTATAHAPWHVIPADNKWYTRLVVACAIVQAMARLDLHYPQIDSVKRKELEAAREQLLRD
jgi:PPK2 family polyphosphate:nucleotide phosphotransferase